MRNEQKSILIYYEGETERNYIDGLRKYFNDRYRLNKNHFRFSFKRSLVSVNLIKKCEKNLKRNDWDHIFIVQDREEIQDRINTLKESENYLKNIEKKYRDRISIIVSNPSFEFWLCLHFEELTNKHIKIKQLEDRLSKITNVLYDKSDIKNWLDKNIFDNFDKIDTAILNAKKIMNKNNEKYEFCESNFYELIDYILKR